MFPIFACVLYGLMILVGRTLFANRERLHWRYTLASWNLLLSVFSVVGMLRTAPHLFYNLTHMSIHENLCTNPRYTYGSGSTGLWTQLFVLSKFP